MRRSVIGAGIGVLTALGLGGAMLPLRSHLSIATSALVLVVPVVLGVVVGGFFAGLSGVAAGFLIYELAFIPPYGTLTVGDAQNWVALGVYAVVMVLVARVVAHLDQARTASQARATSARHLYELSEILLRDRPLPELGQAAIEQMCTSFQLQGAELFLSVGGVLERVAISGSALNDSRETGLRQLPGTPVTLNTLTSAEPIQTLALVGSNGPIGLLVLYGLPNEPAARELLPILANHVALAFERAALREQALRVELLEEVDRLRRALLGAVSHDLRTPLATIKIASSTLTESGTTFPEEDRRELYQLIDTQTDRLSRLVNNLLDMTRIQAGVLEVHRAPCSIIDLVGGVIAELRPFLGDRSIELQIPDQLPLVDIDHLLIEQVLANIVDNAHRHSPVNGSIVITAAARDEHRVILSVSDEGPGVPAGEQLAIFETFVRFDTGGRAGLGLAIAKAFVEAHGETIWVEDAPKGGARFSFSLPTVAISKLIG